MKKREKKEKVKKPLYKRILSVIAVLFVIMIGIAVLTSGESETSAPETEVASHEREYACLVYDNNGIAVDATHSKNGDDGRVKAVKLMVYNDTDTDKRFLGWRTDVNGEWMATTGEATVTAGGTAELEIVLEGIKADPDGSFDVVVIRLQVFDTDGELLEEIELDRLLFET